MINSRIISLSRRRQLWYCRSSSLVLRLIIQRRLTRAYSPLSYAEISRRRASRVTYYGYQRHCMYVVARQLCASQVIHATPSHHSPRIVTSHRPCHAHEFTISLRWMIIWRFPRWGFRYLVTRWRCAYRFPYLRFMINNAFPRHWSDDNAAPLGVAFWVTAMVLNTASCATNAALNL